MEELELAIACGPDHTCHRKLNAMHLLIIGVPFELVVRNSLSDEHHWTARKLCGWLNDTLDTKLSYSTVVRYLHEHDYKRKIPRPMPEPSDPEKWEQQREAFIGELPELLEEENTVPYSSGMKLALRAIPVLAKSR